ncbi:MAG TPA: rRNA maturation RNase YbeY [Candidatus Acidoferrum sp.]|nr:rRNA maturation RNase YbeY [Candidatus Acidoferrum sp.]
MNILNKQTKIRLSLPQLETFADEVLRELNLKPENLSIAFVSNPAIAHLNKTYRKIAKATDVLSFPAEANARLNRHRFLGDIAIAPSVAQRYAKKNGRTLQNEICILILHGVLHLMGYDHEVDQGQMDRVERKLRRKLRLEP